MNKILVRFLLCLTACLFSCSKKNFDFVDGLFVGEKAQITKIKNINENFVVLLHKDPSSGEEQLFVTRDNKVVVAVKPFGNGNTITVPEPSNNPGVLVHQTQSLEVIRYVYSDDGGVKEIIYQDDGQIDIERKLNQKR